MTSCLPAILQRSSRSFLVIFMTRSYQRRTELPNPSGPPGFLSKSHCNYVNHETEPVHAKKEVQGGNGATAVAVEPVWAVRLEKNSARRIDNLKRQNRGGAWPSPLRSTSAPIGAPIVRRWRRTRLPGDRTPGANNRYASVDAAAVADDGADGRAALPLPGRCLRKDTSRVQPSDRPNAPPSTQSVSAKREEGYSCPVRRAPGGSLSQRTPLKSKAPGNPGAHSAYHYLNRAGEETRTLNPLLGKQMLCH